MARLLHAIVGVVVLGVCGVALGQQINVHIVPHSHDDVGWLKTVEQYYTGEEIEGNIDCVECILTSVTEFLEADPKKKYIQVETAFFERWWRDQTDDKKERVKKLVADGQLEFINAGWCMNDEATVHYQGVIDQMSLGVRFINDTFGVVPKIGWQIDPFGHSATQAQIFADMGMEAMVINRVDFNDLATRKANKEMEFLWRPSKSRGKESQIFTYLTHKHYNPPDEFDFDTQRGSDHLDNKEMEFLWRPSKSRGKESQIFTYLTHKHYSPPDGFYFDVQRGSDHLDEDNLDEKARDFLEVTLDAASVYRTNNVMWTMGEDFHYSNASGWFDALDLLINFYEETDDPDFQQLKLFYSTPSIYFQFVRDAAEELGILDDWPIKENDFFPYGDGPNGYWTGYFTSRAALKLYERVNNAYLQTCRQLDLFDFLTSSDDRINFIQQDDAMGILQHHDGVSGTEKQAVADDYAFELDLGHQQCEARISQALGQLTADSPDQDAVTFSECERMNVSVCDSTSEPGVKAVVVYNSLGQGRDVHVRIPVPNDQVKVTLGDGTEVDVAILPGDNPYDPAGVGADAQPFIADFEVSLPALGWNTYFLHVPESESPGEDEAQKLLDVEEFVLENDFLRVEFSQESGKISAITDKAAENPEAMTFEQNFWFYKSIEDNPGQQSGAYLFRPVVDTTTGEEYDATITQQFLDLPGVQEIHQEFSFNGGDVYVRQIVRLYANAEFLEFEHTVGPIDTSVNPAGVEVITRLSTKINNAVSDEDQNPVLFTDENCRDMMTRILNERDTFELIGEEPIAQNYYPINCAAVIKDAGTGTEVTMLTDRSQGAASIRVGELEIMVHRRLGIDDARGVGEPLNELGRGGDGLVVRGRHRLVVGDAERSAALRRRLQDDLNYVPNVVFTDLGDQSVEEYADSHILRFCACDSLPANVHLLTLQRVHETEILLRLSHNFEIDEHSTLSQPQTVSIASVVSRTFDHDLLEIDTVTELGLGGNRARQQLLDDLLRFDPSDEDATVAVPEGPDFNFDISAMEIRTFQVTLRPARDSDQSTGSSGAAGLQTWQIVFIALGGVCATVVLTAIVLSFYRRRSRKSADFTLLGHHSASSIIEFDSQDRV